MLTGSPPSPPKSGDSSEERLSVCGGDLGLAAGRTNERGVAVGFERELPARLDPVFVGPPLRERYRVGRTARELDFACFHGCWSCYGRWPGDDG